MVPFHAKSSFGLVKAPICLEFVLQEHEHRYDVGSIFGINVVILHKLEGGGFFDIADLIVDCRLADARRVLSIRADRIEIL